MCLVSVRVFLESLSKISAAAELCQKGKGKKEKIPALSPRAPSGIFALT